MPLYPLRRNNRGKNFRIGRLQFGYSISRSDDLLWAVNTDNSNRMTMFLSVHKTEKEFEGRVVSLYGLIVGPLALRFGFITN